MSSQFDWSKYEPSQAEKPSGGFDWSKYEKPTEPTSEKIARKVLIPLKGAADVGIGKFGDLANLFKTLNEQEKQEAESFFSKHPKLSAIRDFFRAPSEKLLELGTRLPTSEELRKKGEIAPATEAESLLRAAGEGVGSIIGLPGATKALNILGGAGAGVGAEVAKMNEAGPAGQITGALIGDILSRKLGKSLISLGAKGGIPAAQKYISGAKWENLERTFGSTPQGEKALEFAKTRNLTPEEASLLLQSRGKQDVVSWMSKGNAKTEAVAEGLRKKLGEEYSEIIKAGRKQPIGLEASLKLDDELANILDDLEATATRSPETEAAIKKIRDTKNYIDDHVTSVEELINAKQNMGDVSWTNVHKGKAMRAKANQAINEAITQAYPEAGEQLRFLDAHYAKLKDVIPSLENKGFINFKGIKVPNAFQIPLILGAALKSPMIAAGLMGKSLVNAIARNLLVNPNYQGVARQMIAAAEKGSITAMKTSWGRFLQIARQKDPDLYEKVKDISID